MTERGLKNINVFYSTFTNVFFVTFLKFLLTFFYFFFWNVFFYIYDVPGIPGGVDAYGWPYRQDGRDEAAYLAVSLASCSRCGCTTESRFGRRISPRRPVVSAASLGHAAMTDGRTDGLAAKEDAPLLLLLPSGGYRHTEKLQVLL